MRASFERYCKENKTKPINYDQRMYLIPELSTLIESGDAKRLIDFMKINAKQEKESMLCYLSEIYSRYGIDGLRKKPNITVGTIHSVKGGEADHVILFPDLPPAALDSWHSGRRDAIIRLFYVAITRAKYRLSIADAFGSGNSII